jgi:serine/threonine-protein kinase HipA
MNQIQVIEVGMHAQKVGRMVQTSDYLCAFEYDEEFLQSGSSISPFHLPLRKEVFLAKRTPFTGGFGVFDDSLPDGWGSLILDRFLRSKGINPATLTLLQRFALVGSTGRGALEYRPDFSETSKDEQLDFDKLAQETALMLSSESNGDSVETLYRQGGSPGGARPKVFVTLDNKEWLVKFKSTTDPHTIGEIEYTYSLLAKKCRIAMPETRLVEGKYFAVERFDRSALGKIHTISAAGLLNANYREPSLDYESLLQACHALTKNMEEVTKLFRIMVFNVAIHNRDDHAKNFSFQWIHQEWKLAPAYDLLPSSGFNGFHTTTVNSNASPTRSDMLAVAKRTGISETQARAIISEVFDLISSSSKELT